MKTILLVILPLFLMSCSSSTKDEGCPEIFIPRDTARYYQNNGSFDEFQVNFVGAESYCYTEPANNRRYAVITPIFKVRRLEAGTTTRLDVGFYIKTSVNAENYLGTKTFSQSLSIPQSVKEATIKGRQTVNRIANPPYDGFSISAGMVLSGNAQNKARGMFDINYRYLSAEDIAADEASEIDTVYLEIANDEEVIYSDNEKKPIVVKKNRKKNGCQN